MERLIRLRKWIDGQDGMTAAKLSRELGCSETHMSDVIAGKRRASADLAGGLQAKTGIDARYFLRIPIIDDADADRVRAA
ncbi:helix-turn-helix transcriptional regulator [Hyphomonas sp.]|uniref:helix-turn-helix domain-containing protein n=1 Tax=Hyphomonas sp. TaxID=87 RepID=UPI0025BA496A|nr:helix-turn-helix transcriptional regulator [Hyphomonas sp.]